MGVSIEISNNGALTSLEGLEGIREIGTGTESYEAKLEFRNNAVLTDVSALAGTEVLAFGPSSPTTLLPTCSAHALVEALGVAAAAETRSARARVCAADRARARWTRVGEEPRRRRCMLGFQRGPRVSSSAEVSLRPPLTS